MNLKAKNRGAQPILYYTKLLLLALLSTEGCVQHERERIQWAP